MFMVLADKEIVFIEPTKTGTFSNDDKVKRIYDSLPSKHLHHPIQMYVHLLIVHVAQNYLKI